MSVVALDCEMVASGNRSLLARVSIVNRNGSVLFDEYVRPTAVVTDYRTCVSGIKRVEVDSGRPFRDVKSQVSEFLRGNVLVGHSLKFDLDVLELSHPDSQKRDLAKYEPYMKGGQPQSLRTLAKMHLNKSIQEGEHDSVEDAKIAMQLYLLVQNKWY